MTEPAITTEENDELATPRPTEGIRLVKVAHWFRTRLPTIDGLPRIDEDALSEEPAQESAPRASGTMKISAFALRTTKMAPFTHAALEPAKPPPPAEAPRVITPWRPRPERFLLPASVVLAMIGIVLCARSSPSTPQVVDTKPTAMSFTCEPECVAWVDGKKVTVQRAVIAPGDGSSLTIRLGTP